VEVRDFEEWLRWEVEQCLGFLNDKDILDTTGSKAKNFVAIPDGLKSSKV
jgi:hypothetical protein